MSQTPSIPGAPGNFQGFMQSKFMKDYDQFTPEQKFQLFQGYGQAAFGGGDLGGVAALAKGLRYSPEEYAAIRQVDKEAKLDEAKLVSKEDEGPIRLTKLKFKSNTDIEQEVETLAKEFIKDL